MYFSQDGQFAPLVNAAIYLCGIAIGEDFTYPLLGVLYLVVCKGDGNVSDTFNFI